MKRFLAIFCLLAAGPAALARQGPPLPYESWDVCPFECCTYRDWKAEADIPVHERRDDRSKVRFRVRRGETVRAETGVVVTAVPGIVRIDKPVRDGYPKNDDRPHLSLVPGDVIYRLAPLGEGAFLFWYKGKVYQSGTDLVALPTINEGKERMTWWKRVRNRAGKKGWTRSIDFSNADACG
jgi:hypothetical protein